MTRDNAKVYEILYKYGPFTDTQMKKLLAEEKFEMQWIGAQNTSGKYRIAIMRTAEHSFYGLTDDGVKQLNEWE